MTLARALHIDLAPAATAAATAAVEPLHIARPGQVEAAKSMTLAFRAPEAAVIWLTGLSGAGKSTIAEEVCRRVRATRARVELIDGDAIRAAFPATGFTPEERDAHIRRVGFFASRLEHHGVVVVCALISPYAASRACARALCNRFIEVHVSTPLEECERRDVKGLYRRARLGEIAHFTGIGDAYEPPSHPELRIDTTSISVDTAADLVIAALLSGQSTP